MRLLSCFIAVAVAVSASPPAGAAPRCVAVLGTNDLHGAIEPFTNTAGAASVRYGGLVSTSGYLRILQAHYGDRWVLVDGGDLYQGTLASNLSRGEAIVAAYNLLGYHASAVGNHEFDFGPVEPNDPDRLGVFKRRIDEATFSFLTLNVFEKATHNRVDWNETSPSIIVDAGGIKVGIIGVSTPDTPQVTLPQNVASLDFPQPAPLVIAEARRLRALGAELVVMTAHLGGKCSDTKNPHDRSGCDHGDLMKLLDAVPAGTIDVAVGGHTHRKIAHWINGAATIEAGARGRYVAWVRACLLPGGGIDPLKSQIHAPVQTCLDTWSDGTCYRRDEAKRTKPATFMGKRVEPDPKLLTLLAPYMARVAEVNAEDLGVDVPKPLSRNPRGDEINLGAMVAEALQSVGRAQLAVQNLGGVRANLPAGRLTYGQVYEVLPFDNKVAVVELDGAQVQTFIEHMVARREGDLPFMSGVEVTREGKALKITVGEAPLEPTVRYRVATNDFMARGGEGLDELWRELPAERFDYSDVDMRDALIRLLKERYPAAVGGSAAR